VLVAALELARAPSLAAWLRLDAALTLLVSEEVLAATNAGAIDDVPLAPQGGATRGTASATLELVPLLLVPALALGLTPKTLEAALTLMLDMVALEAEGAKATDALLAAPHRATGESATATLGSDRLAPRELDATLVVLEVLEAET
jgi:hypothetical protein